MNTFIKQQHQCEFLYNGLLHKIAITPEEPDWWEQFESHNLVFDVHFLNQGRNGYNQIEVYPIVQGETQTQHCIHVQPLSLS